MRVDVAGRVANMVLSPHRSLAPLYEAVVNSIEAVHEHGDADGGRIDIHVVRDSPGSALDGTPSDTLPVSGFAVRDNGVGFNRANLESFSTSDTTFKKELGGKGVGRFLWLKAFDSVRVRSVFEEGGQRHERRFMFSTGADGVADEKVREAVAEPVETVVELVGFKPQYRRGCPKKLEEIADSIIEHCLEHLALEDCPAIYVRDDYGGPVHLNSRFRLVLVLDSHDAGFHVRGTPFQVKHLRLHSNTNMPATIHYCAHRRVVRSTKIMKQIPELAAKTDGRHRAFTYAAYVSGDYLDEHVNPERTNFTFPRTREQETMYDVCEDELDGTVIEQSRSYLKPYIDPIRERTISRVRQYVETQAPQYRHVLKSRPEQIGSIPPDLGDDELEVKLYEIDHSIRSKMNEEARRAIQGYDGSPDRSAEVERVLARVSEVSQGDLARYVIQRRLILELLTKSLGLSEDGTYSRESEIHRIIYPMGATSESLEEYEAQNLWIIDERLSYHAYLASDRPLKAMEPIDSSSSLRPDIAVFNRVAYVDGEAPYSSVTIVELKRPVRAQYDERDNPLAQVYDYISEIRRGTVTDGNGRPISVHTSASFYVYIIADMTEALRKQAENGSLTLTPDEMGYFGYNANHRAYVEIISYTKLITDAKKRNRVLFEKLNLPLSTTE